MQQVNKYFEEWLFIQENGKRTLTTKSDKHCTSFPFRVKENVFGKYTISYPMWILNIHRKGDGQHGGCACASAHPDNT